MNSKRKFIVPIPLFRQLRIKILNRYNILQGVSQSIQAYPLLLKNE